MLSKVCSKYNEQKNKCKKEITELLTALCNNRQVELEILQGVNCIVGLEQGALIIIIRNIFSRWNIVMKNFPDLSSLENWIKYAY